MVFRSLYRAAVLQGLHESQNHWSEQILKEQAALVESHLVTLFDYFQWTGRPSVELRREQLMSQSGRLCQLRSNKLCLYCLFNTPQHLLACGHALCDRCAQLFGTPASAIEYQFTVSSCVYCLYQRPLVIDVLPPMMNPTILAIDGGGVRGVIPLEYLILIQESLSPFCRLQDLVDLAVGTSSGKFSRTDDSYMSA